MIQFNLLPDVKLEFIKAQKTRRLVISVSLIVTAATVGVLLLTLSVDGLQKKHLSDLNANITTESSKLRAEPNLTTVLTVQNQLSSLTTLHNGKPAVSQLFSYLNEVTPSTVSINDFTADFTTSTASVTGNAANLSEINQYVDTLKLTTYSTMVNKTPTYAFTNVVLSNFGLNPTAANKNQAASYTVTFSFAKPIFDITQKVTLSVPAQTTTRTEVSQPSDLFTAAPATTTTTGSN